jgi:hypothetical protein
VKLETAVNTLEKVAHVDWNSMGSPNITRWMDELIAGDRQTQWNAYDEMANYHLAPPECVMCSCNVEDLLALVKRDTAFRLIPFLIELLEANNIQDNAKYFILTLLVALLRYDEAEVCLPEAERENYRPYVRRLYDAVNAGMQTYRQLINNQSDNVSSSASTVIEYLESFYNQDTSN